MKRRIDILIPTWGRPERLKEAVQSIFVNIEREPPGSTQVWVRVALEDPALEAYRALQAIEIRVHWEFASGCTGYAAGIERLRQIAMLGDGDIFFCGSDDSLFRTRGWDIFVEEAFRQAPDDLLVAYANNGLGREKCEQFFTTRRWIETVGWLMRREYEHFCCDQDVEALASAVGRLHFLREVTVEHMHVKYGKAEMDDTYRKVRGKTGTNERDLATFAALAQERVGAINRLQAALR